MSFLAPLMQLAGTAISAGGSIAAGQQQQRIGAYDQQVAGLNAQQALAAGQTNAAVIGQQTTRGIGRAAAAYGAAGVETSGSPLAVMADLAAQGELRKRLALYSGQLSSASDTAQGGIAAAEGKAAASPGIIRGGGTLLTGTAQAGQALNTLLRPSPGGAGTSPLAGS